MFISSSMNFIFIHTYKTAGTSIIKYFSDRKIGKSHKDLRISPHLRAFQIRDMLGPVVYSQMFSFAFVRNPWDYEYSLYKYVLRRLDHAQHNVFKRFKNYEHYVKFCYDNFLAKNEHPFFSDQKQFVCESTGPLIVNFIGRFEQLNEDFLTICNKIKLNASESLSHENKSTNGEYREVYNSKMVDYVSTVRSGDIVYFKYDFE